ncbi:glutathione S-transferase [Shewanella goraebulensis]|uniref:glutathione S-transferase n=1 Tax=Shewanella goraebulensis TaxID=3050637 RepID=UPI00254BEBDB|nr:glutathione S-transferase [Shewanella goraebulensis]
MILYSFRRCPYAMRARLGLHLSSLNPQVREIILKNKPAEMLEISPKGTVPVLAIQSESQHQYESITNKWLILEESLDIINYSLSHYPATNYKYLCKDEYDLLIESLTDKDTKALIDINDNEFKPWLDKYKYADRHLEFTEEYYREKACKFIAILEAKLNDKEHLLANSPTFADYAIFPFVRQFAHVNRSWFEQSQYSQVKKWLKHHIESDLFQSVMCKYPLWLDDKTLKTKLKQS